jgi:hypothetical protein
MKKYSSLKLAYDIAERVTKKDVEYLMLIDCYNFRDHRRGLYNALYEEMLTNGIKVQRFFFAYSPLICRNEELICRNEEFKSGCELKELLAKRKNAVLMIFTGGLQFIDTFAMKTFGWVNIFKGWEKRYFFSSEQFCMWGEREKILRQVFPFVLPFSIEGMRFMTKSLSKNVPATAWTEEDPSYLLMPISDNNKNLEYIGFFFDQAMRRWIASCAITTSKDDVLWDCLSWNLTLALSEKLGEMYPEDVSSLRAEQLLKLEWFIKGEIPDHFRTQLINEWLSMDEYLTLRDFVHSTVVEESF